MRRSILAIVVLITAFAAEPLRAQNPAWTAELIRSVNQAEEKFVALSNAFSTEQYNWRPGEGVRSVQEVLLHVAVDNYFIPALMGVAAPAATKVTATDYAVLQTFEKQKLSKDATTAELKASFEHLRKALNSIPEARLNEKVKAFGQEFTVRQFMVMAATHMHEHLGQMIAYARTNSVVPPWSRNN